MSPLGAILTGGFVAAFVTAAIVDALDLHDPVVAAELGGFGALLGVLLGLGIWILWDERK